MTGKASLFSAPQANWEQCQGEVFSVRGKEYMSNKVKVDSGETLYDCSKVQFLRGTNGTISAAELYQDLDLEGKVKSESSSCGRPDVGPTSGGGSPADSNNSDVALPEYLIINAQLPWEPPSLMFSASKDDFGASLISYHSIKPSYNSRVGGAQSQSPAAKLFQGMLNVGASQRNGISLKAIGFCETWENLGLPDAVKGYNGKPALVTDSAKIYWRNNICIIDFDVRLWSYLAQHSFHSVFSNPSVSKNNSLRIGYLLEGKAVEELPEQMLAAFYIHGADRESFPVVDAGGAENRADNSGGLLKKMFG